MLILGVDENGLGPRLGPLVATAVALDCTGRGYDPRRLRKIGDRAGIGDSKATSAFGAMAHAEGVALALVERVTGGAPRDLDDLLARVGLTESSLGGVAPGALESLRAPCDGGSRPQCWSAELPLPAFGGSLDVGRRMLDRLARAGLEPVRARSAIACVRVYNREVARRGSKLCVDLELFERLVLDARGALPGELTALCGMVGGIRRYAGYLAHIDAETLEILEESRLRSVYRAPAVGEIRFEVDADATHVPVGLASMLGKYVRELCVDRQNRFYQSHDPALPSVSGYHDPVTARFVLATAELRRKLAIASDCFERTS